MNVMHVKGDRRHELDAKRIEHGEPRQNADRNNTLHCKYAAGSKASRNRGRNRFKTGKKQH